MSNRSLVEINHDFPFTRHDADVLHWAKKILRYIGSGDAMDLPNGMRLKHFRHHSDPDPMEARTTTTDAGERADAERIAKLEAEVASLKNRTAVHIGYTDIPTGHRVNLYAPERKCFEIAGERPLALQLAGRTDLVGSESFQDDAPKHDIRALIDAERASGGAGE